MTAVLLAARSALRRGRQPVPIPLGQKSPARKDWPSLRLTEDTVTQAFHGDMNIGILNGAPSRNQIDVDLDCPEALVVADQCLPPTSASFGRLSKPRSHRLYRCDPLPTTTQYRDTDGAMLLEIRSTGTQTLFPPSRHPSGEEVVWHEDGEVTCVEADLLLNAVQTTAASCILARHWPSAGARHDAALALAGGLLRHGWGEVAVGAFIAAVAEAAGDEETRDRARTADYTARRLEQGHTATGWTRLAQYVGSDVVARVRDWLGVPSSAVSRHQHEIVAARFEEPYVATDVGTIWRKPTAEGAVDVRLANFSAVIVDDVIEDDGAEERRVFVLEATLRGTVHRITVPAPQFAGMSWVAERLGAGAILDPGQGTKERFRHAIQLLSGEVPLRRVYSHTGWRLIDGAWVYLHGAGAIGPNGLVAGVEVGLRGPLSRFVLPDPPMGEALTQAILGALRLLDLLPPEIAYLLLGATWLAPLRELLGEDAPDFVVWLHGPSGSFKSEILALGQSFYGEFTRQSLPVNFSATANAVERLLFEAKDALLAVDDFHPAGDLREQQAMNQVARRLLRGAGNQSGRARMRADTTLRPALNPRCLAIASGERLPEGHSNVARMYPVAVARGAVDRRHLGTLQDQRQLYPVAMAGYLRHIAPRFSALQASLTLRFKALRTDLQISGGHAREPGQLAHLLLGLETFLDFAVDIGASTADVRAGHLQAARHVLLAQAQEHAQVQAEEAPEQVFVRLLSGGVAGKRAYLEDKHGGAPVNAGLWGWEPVTQRDAFGLEEESWRHPSTAQLVGVVDGEWLLLYPEQIFQFVVGAARAAGGTFPVDPRTLLRRLDEAGLIATESENGQRRYKVNAWIDGSTKRVVKLRRDAVVLSCGEEREDWEEREDPAPVHADRTAAPSQISGTGAATGKAFPEDYQVTGASLPGLPTLPGFHAEGDVVAPEELDEWRG